MQRGNYLVAAGILLFMGILFAGIAIYIFYGDYALARDGVQVEGTVISLAMSQDDDGSASYAPVVRFTSASGREFTFTGTVYSSPPAYKTGQTVTILYPPDSPGEAKIQGEGNLLMLIFGIVGGFEILLGLFFSGKAMLAQIHGE